MGSLSALSEEAAARREASKLENPEPAGTQRPRHPLRGAVGSRAEKERKRVCPYSGPQPANARSNVCGLWVWPRLRVPPSCGRAVRASGSLAPRTPRTSRVTNTGRQAGSLALRSLCSLCVIQPADWPLPWRVEVSTQRTQSPQSRHPGSAYSANFACGQYRQTGRQSGSALSALFACDSTGRLAAPLACGSLNPKNTKPTESAPQLRVLRKLRVWPIPANRPSVWLCVLCALCVSDRPLPLPHGSLNPKNTKFPKPAPPVPRTPRTLREANTGRQAVSLALRTRVCAVKRRAAADVPGFRNFGFSLRRASARSA